MTEQISKLLVVAGFAALRDAVTKYPNARVMHLETPYHEEPLVDLTKFVPAPIDSKPSRGPAPRRKFPVRR